MSDYHTILEILKNRHETLGCAESCTGGHIAASITQIPGSSAVFRGGIVAYHADIKQNLLNVHPEILSHFQIVSRETAVAMAAGTAHQLSTDWAIATTGYAGPTGGDNRYPVGTVCFGLYAPKHQIICGIAHHFEGSRQEVILKATDFALDLLLAHLI